MVTYLRVRYSIWVYYIQPKTRVKLKQSATHRKVRCTSCYFSKLFTAHRIHHSNCRDLNDVIDTDKIAAANRHDLLARLICQGFGEINRIDQDLDFFHIDNRLYVNILQDLDPAVKVFPGEESCLLKVQISPKSGWYNPSQENTYAIHQPRGFYFARDNPDHRFYDP